MSSYVDSIVAPEPSSQRNYVLSSLRKDSLIEFMKDMLNHSFVLDAKDLIGRNAY